jgi:endonuclease YncB( thermonuclease family)
MNDMPEVQYVYRCDIERVIDGDTVVGTVDAGFGLWLHRGNEGAHLRLLGVDTPERNEKGWDAARQFTAAWVREAGSANPEHRWPFVIRTEKADAFGRYLARIWRVSDGRCLNDDLLSEGHAVVMIRTPQVGG